MRVKLTELYNTRYFYLTYKRDLTYLFSTVLELMSNESHPYNPGNELLEQVYKEAQAKRQVEFDLANAKITPDVLDTIKSYAGKGLIFVDSKDGWRDEILAENRRRGEVDLSEFEILPPYSTTQLIKDYVTSLDKTKKYMMPNNDPEVYIPLVYITMVVRPSIIINLGGYCNSFFQFVGKRLTIADLEGYTEFYFTSPEGTMILDFSQGQTYVQRIGLSDIQSALTVGTLVPTVLGSQRLLNQGVWHVIFKSCLGMLNGYRATRKKNLAEILEVEE